MHVSFNEVDDGNRKGLNVFRYLYVLRTIIPIPWTSLQVGFVIWSKC